MFKTPYLQQRDARQQNASGLLRDLWRHAPLSKAMLAQRNGLTKATVSAICSDLASMNLIQEVGQDRTGLGRPGNLLELRAASRCAIGVEISTNYTAAMLTDLCGQPLWQDSILIAIGSSQEAILSQSEALIAEAIGQAAQRDTPVLGIGVGAPGIVDPGRENRISTPALGWKEAPLKQTWETRFRLPVIVDNKARTAAMAEALNGSAQNASSFIYISVGTNVQSSVEAAVVNDGFPYRGSRGLAVDAGHMVLDPQGPLCSCGQRGCWQVMVDVQREVELALARLAAGESSVLQSWIAETDERGGAPLPLDHATIHTAALAGDALALEILRTVQGNHALGITNLVRIFDPELVIIGWAAAALSPATHVRMQRLSALIDAPGAVRRHLARRGAACPDIVQAAHGPDACMLGAAALVLDDFFRKPPTSEG